MCLAIPGRILSVNGESATVDFGGNRMPVCTTLTPGVSPNDWVLVHAGFSITTIDETAARETWEYLSAAGGEDVADLVREVEADDG
jgi:hydrogenase expression/formation protein HypC